MANYRLMLRVVEVELGGFVGEEIISDHFRKCPVQDQRRNQE